MLYRFSNWRCKWNQYDFIDKVKDIGIYHLLVVSGSHIATISFLIYQPLVRLNIPKVN